jgi:hypothetical protein
MSVSPKSSNTTQLFRLMLYNRPLHPELFNLENRRVDHHGEYEVENWIISRGHVVRFQLGQQVLTETVVEQGDHLPENGLIHALPCIGEKEYDMDPLGRLRYFTTIQTEALTDNLFMATYREMQEFARETGALAREWEGDNGALFLSLLDTQKYKREFHVQSYHLTGDTGLVLRTQSIFEVNS